jgi:hypothetical protein
LFLGGDLNLELNAKECWGERVRTYPLVDYFSNIFEDLNLVDVEPHKVVLTWENSRRGRDGIEKRLDQFLVAERFMEEASRYKTWVGWEGFPTMCLFCYSLKS